MLGNWLLKKKFSGPTIMEVSISTKLFQIGFWSLSSFEGLPSPTSHCVIMRKKQEPIPVCLSIPEGKKYSPKCTLNWIFLPPSSFKMVCNSLLAMMLYFAKQKYYFTDTVVNLWCIYLHKPFIKLFNKGYDERSI